MDVRRPTTLSATLPSWRMVLDFSWCSSYQGLHSGAFLMQWPMQIAQSTVKTAHMASIWTILVAGGKKRWPGYLMDVKSAFLNEDLKEEVCVKQRPGFTSKCFSIDSENWYNKPSFSFVIKVYILNFWQIFFLLYDTFLKNIYHWHKGSKVSSTSEHHHTMKQIN